MKNILLSFLFLIPLTSFALTSEQNRANKKLELSLQAAPRDYRLTNIAVAGMYFIDANNLIGLKLGSSNGKENQDSIAVQYKRYLSNTFYIAPEVFYLRSREDIYGFWGNIFGPNDYATHSSMGASVRIGNQWTWENFTLGCDWVGIGHRVGTFKKETERLHDTTFTILNLIVGWSF